MKIFVSLMILLLHGALGLEGPLCEVPQIPDNGYFKMSDQRLNGTVTYYCHDGYWYTGTSSRACQANGKWSGSAGICKVVECSSLTAPLNGKLKLTGQAFGDEATVTCDEGYIYSDPQFNLRICQGDNTWTSKAGTCDEVRCPDLPEPSYGKIQYSGKGYMEKANIGCNTGYVYSKPESSTVTCQGDNTWSLKFDGKCQKRKCPIIPDMADRVVSSNQSSYQSNITIRCKSGYVLQGPFQTTCGADGLWSPSPGQCVKNKKLFLLFLLVVPAAVPMLLLVVRFVRQKRQRKENHHAEEYKLIEPQDDEVLYHCYFYMKNKFDAGNSIQTSPEYTSFAADIREKVERIIKANTGGKNVHVSVSFISQLNQAVYLDILCPETTTRRQLEEWIPLNKEIVKDSVKFRDSVTASLGTEIMTRKHVTDTELDRAIDLDSEYVQLRVVPNKEMTTLHRDEIELLPHTYQRVQNERTPSDIKDEELITKRDDKFVVIRGRAGVGKTTLAQRLLRRWARGEWATHLKAIFMLNLRVLSGISSTLDIGYILAHCGVYRIRNGLPENWLMENEESFGVVLDGLDEMNNFENLWRNADAKMTGENVNTLKSPLDWCISLLKRESFPGATLIVTSRPFAALTLITSKETKMVEVMGLTRDRVLKFIEQNVRRQWIASVKQSMENNPILMSVSAITFYCASLCRVLQTHVGIVEKLTTYTEITAYIMKDFMNRAMKGQKEIDCLKQKSEGIHSMCEMAYQSIFRSSEKAHLQLVFSRNEYEERIQKEDVEVTRKAGLFIETELSKSSTGSTEKEVRGEFVHLCIQELMAIVGLLMQTEEEIKKALDTLYTSGQFNMSLLFLYGFVFNNSNETIQSLWSTVAGSTTVNTAISSALTKKIHEIEDDLLLLQVIHESQSPELAQQVGEYRFSSGLEFEETKLTVVDILAIGFLIKHHPTSSIKLSGTGLDVFSMKELTQCLSDNTTVTSLTLKGDTTDKTWLKYISGLLKVNRVLEDLDISSGVNDEGIISIMTGLRSNRVLKHLRIGSDDVTDLGVAQIADMLRGNKYLTELEIASNQITDKGIVAFASALRENKTLENLMLPGAVLRDEGAEALLLAISDNKHVKVQFHKQNCEKELADKIKVHPRITV